MEENNKEFHLCYYYCGKISDVTFRIFAGTIHCRRCGKELKDCEIEANTFKIVNIKRENLRESDLRKHSKRIII